MISNSIMKKYLVVSVLGIFSLCSLSAQDFKLAKTSGKLVVNLSRVEIEGYDGKELFLVQADQSRK